MAYDDHHDVIVERDGTGVGTILGIILAIVVVLALVWFFFLGGMGNTMNPGTDQTNITIEQPNPNPPVVPVP